MKDLNKKRTKRNKIKEAQECLLQSYELQKIERFKDAYIEKTIEDVEFNHNISLIMNTVNNWLKKLKKDKPQYKLLESMSFSSIKILAYQINLRSTMKRIMVEMLEYKRLWGLVSDENIGLKKTIESLKNEVKHYENGN